MYTVRKYSDPLLLHMLKKKMPQEHGDSIKIDQTTTIKGSLGLESLAPESRTELRAILEREKNRGVAAALDKDDVPNPN